MARKLGKKKDRVEPKYWHAFIATPAYDGKVDVDYAQSMCESAFMSPIQRVVFSAAVMGNGAFIDLARNTFVKMFLEDKDATHLFFIDADLKFPHNAFIGLMRSDLPICAGVYPKRSKIEEYPARWSENPDGGGLWMDGDWLFCDRVPTGFLCIRRDVVEKMAAKAEVMNIHNTGEVPRLFYTKLDEENRFIGEDYCFCDDYIEQFGEPIRVWPNIDFKHGGIEGNFYDFLEREIEKEEQATSAA